ncbi:energy transducer TonB [Lutibacter sp.]|uniref:energy transducer TonB n=1 Tax=Lutibacter sp. TaxID=1925666 RepID=UPI0025C21C52|nr:energy transducer TonB [Lutibacter sp.]MCF6167946.1 energy transducer TonB [Lutibacter sp.]
MLRFLDTKNKRKSAVLTSVIMSLLLISIFFVGITYLDPPEEYGIAINFGTSNVGMGNVQPKAPLKTVSEEKIMEEKQEEVQETSEPKIKEKVSEAVEDVATQNNEESIAIKKKQDGKRKADEIARKKQLEKDKIERAKQAAIAKQKAEEAAKRKKLDALIGGINNSSGTANGGEGNDLTPGDKGNINGDPNANGYYGNGGGGGSGDYNLGNRKPINRPKPNYVCNEEGLVVVRIEVNTYGKVIKATPGVKGSTNTAQCLLIQAKEAALKTTWQPDTNAPSKQVGTIKYRFSLSQ